MVGCSSWLHISVLDLIFMCDLITRAYEPQWVWRNVYGNRISMPRTASDLLPVTFHIWCHVNKWKEKLSLEQGSFSLALASIVSKQQICFALFLLKSRVLSIPYVPFRKSPLCPGYPLPWHLATHGCLPHLYSVSVILLALLACTCSHPTPIPS